MIELRRGFIFRFPVQRNSCHDVSTVEASGAAVVAWEVTLHQSLRGSHPVAGRNGLAPRRRASNSHVLQANPLAACAESPLAGP